MKNLKIYIIGFMVVFVAACSSDLTSKNYDEINPSIFPKSAADVEALVIGSGYYPLRGSWGNGIHSTSENGLMFNLDATTEILQGAYGVQQNDSYHSYNPTIAGVTQFYDKFYNKISSMTLSIDRIQNAPVPDDVKKSGIAELRCARGLLAYELFDMYGPIVIAPLDVLQHPLVETPLARLSNTDMVKYIESDLLAAAQDLKTPQDATYGRFSQGLARMILIRLYLHEKRWADVEAQTNAIMAMNYYKLDSDYVALWDTKAPVDSKEVIWAIPCDYAGTSENQWQLMVLPGNYPGKQGYGTIQSSWSFYDSFEANDVRKTNLITNYIGTDGVTYNRAHPGSYMQLGPIPLKISADASRTTGLTTVDIIMYRYADVLLSKAEALANKTGTPTQEAIDLINIVRTRAGLGTVLLANYSTIDSFNTMLLLERSHEYWCENGQYRSDLIRMNKYSAHCDQLNGASSQSAPYKDVFPFSLARITEGKGLFLQNPGYN
jgi:hypothetical protein